jgi:hypothetical protein
MTEVLLALFAFNRTNVANPVSRWLGWADTDLVEVIGRVSNETDSEYLNDRLVLLFVGSDEVARSVTTWTNFGDGNTPGGFNLRTRLPFSTSVAKLTKTPGASGFNFSYAPRPDVSGDAHFGIRANVTELKETQRIVKLSFPDQRISLTAVVLPGKASRFPKQILSGQNMVLGPLDEISLKKEAYQPLLTPAGLVFRPLSKSLSEEVVERRTFTIRNCSSAQPRTDSYPFTWYFLESTDLGSNHYLGIHAPLLDEPGAASSAPDYPLRDASKTVEVTTPAGTALEVVVAVTEHRTSGDATPEGGAVDHISYQYFNRVSIDATLGQPRPCAPAR